MLVLNGVSVFAETKASYGWGGPIEPWEFHPMLVHFPIVFLLSGVALDLYAWWRGRPDLAWVVNGLLVAGVLTGVPAALTGLLAYFIVEDPQGVHELMTWHLGIQAAALALFAWPAWVGWRNWRVPLTTGPRVVGWIGAVLLIVGSGLGGYMVYHTGAGIKPAILRPELFEDPKDGKGQSH